MPNYDVQFNELVRQFTSSTQERVNRMTVDANYYRTYGEPVNNNENYIKHYNYIPEQFIFHKVNNEEELYLGVELEIDDGGEIQEEAKFVCGFMNRQNENVYCKHDGSLRRGFEIVTHPCTIEYHKKLDYDGLFNELVKKGYRSHNTSTCGLHVHVNRDYFGQDKLTQDLCISKLLYLFEKFWSKVEIIARRKSNRFAERFLLEENDSPLDLYAKSKDSDKYGAINLKHKNTVEIRIFKGTLKTNTFLCTLDFVKTMAKLAKEVDIYEIQFVTWEKVKERFSEELNEYIMEREEQVNKEEKEKVNEMMNSRLTTTYGSVCTPRPDMPISFDSNGTTWYGSYEMSPDGRVAYENLLRAARMDFDTSSVLLNSLIAPPINQQTERTKKEILLEQIKDIKIKIRRSRNGLETTNLNRQLAKLENELRDLRRSNTNNITQ